MAVADNYSPKKTGNELVIVKSGVTSVLREAV